MGSNEEEDILKGWWGSLDKKESSGPHFQILLRTEGQISFLLSSLFPGHFSYWFCVEIQTGSQNQIHMESIAKHNLPHNLFFMDFGWAFWCSLEALEAVFLNFCCLGNRLENGWFSTGNLIHYYWGAPLNLTKFRALKTFQTLTADLQPAASAPMTAEKQPTWTLLKSRRFPKPTAGCPSTEALADYYRLFTKVGKLSKVKS